VWVKRLYNISCPFAFCMINSLFFHKPSGLPGFSIESGRFMVRIFSTPHFFRQDRLTLWLRFAGMVQDGEESKKILSLLIGVLPPYKPQIPKPIRSGSYSRSRVFGGRRVRIFSTISSIICNPSYRSRSYSERVKTNLFSNSVHVADNYGLANTIFSFYPLFIIFIQ
jgi:hypothetical protein